MHHIDYLLGKRIMWLITTFGFFSIVQKPEDKARGTLTIRARVRNDLKALKQSCIPTSGRSRSATTLT